ncbi:MAG: glycosyltransferase family 4 protein [Kiritimatiellia bacterium]
MPQSNPTAPIRVGMIRGLYLHSFEMQTYERMQPQVAFEAYHIRANRFPVGQIQMPIRRVRCIDDVFACVHPRLAFYFDLFLQATCGLDYYHFGLVRALARQQIAHTLETFNAFSYQALLAKRRYGTKLVVTVYENRPFAAERFAAKRRMKYAVLREADLFLAYSARAGACLELEGADPAKIRVLPTGIDIERFHPRVGVSEWRQSLDLAPHDFVFVTVAALRWEKGVNEILQAFAQLVRQAPAAPLKLVFVGAGPERGRLESLARRLGLAPHVRFTRVPYERIHQVYNGADVFLLASAPRPGWLEQFGFVLTEALASGTPIITTQSGSIAEVVGEAARVVPSADFLALSDAMMALWRDPVERRRLGAAGRARAEREYDRDKRAALILDLYRGLLA